MYRKPRTIHFNDTNKNELLKRYSLMELPSVPIVDADNRIVDIVHLKKEIDEDGLKSSGAKNNFVFILAGGKGERLGPLTSIIPKPLIPVGNLPVLEIIMDKFKYYGFGNFILSLNYKAEMIKLYFNNPDIKNKYNRLEYIEEKKPLGTIGSLILAEEYLTDDFLISNADIIIKGDLDEIFRFHQEKNAVLTIVGCIKESVIPYGVLEMSKDGELIALQEKPSLNHVINTGIYVATPEILRYIEKDVYTDITKVIERLLADKKKVAVYQINEEQWFDIGQWDELQKTISFY
jgi:NDP-sugar pyrophosphorylase family protein